ncbi:MAG: prenyltransferase/squalene oxidase repeat-containing protein, partial [Planctomycetota bacterium]|nr:prenyltransferase/squalene oxidase repeat-containing protein [Planctomycetota bacterium]
MKNGLLNVMIGALVLFIGLTGYSRSKDKDKQPTTRPEATTLPNMLMAPVNDAIDAEHLAGVHKNINEGLDFLLKARNADGGWGFAPGQSHPALTAMALKALLQHPQYDNESKVVSDGFKCLLKFRKGHYRHRGNVVCVALLGYVEPPVNLAEF